MTYPGEDALSHALAAVAHPVRRDLLAQVSERPVRVTDLAAGFDISLPAVSRHLKVLENAGLVFLQRNDSEVPESLDTTVGGLVGLFHLSLRG